MKEEAFDAIERARTPGPLHDYLVEQAGTWTGNLDEKIGRATFEGLGSVAALGRQVAMRNEVRVEGDTQIIELYLPGPDDGSAKVMALLYERP